VTNTGAVLFRVELARHVWLYQHANMALPNASALKASPAGRRYAKIPKQSVNQAEFNKSLAMNGRNCTLIYTSAYLVQ
jgi:hypothetical protein